MNVDSLIRIRFSNWRLLLFVPLILLSLLFFATLADSLCRWQGTDIHTQMHWCISPVIVAVALLFLLCKAASLYFAARGTDLGVNNQDMILVMAQSVFIEMTMFPAKLAGDAYKYFSLPGENKKEKIRALLCFRLTSFVPFVFVVLFVVDHFSLMVLIVFGLFAIVLIVFRKVDQSFTAAVLSAMGHLAAFFCWIWQSYLLFHFLGVDNIDILHLAGVLVVAQGLSAISNIPFGLGIREFVIGYSLGSFLGAEQMVIFLLLQRLTGETLTALIGWLSLLPKIIASRKNVTASGR